MEVCERNDLGKNYTLYLMGDTHYPRGRRDKFKKVLNELNKDKNGYMIGLGDWVEGINYDDKRYSPEETAETILLNEIPINMISEQWALFEEEITQVSDKIIGLHNGNHERTYANKTSYNELSRICKRLNIKYLGDGVARIKLMHNGDLINILSAHGIGGGLTAGYPYMQLDKHSQLFAGIDLIAEGHTHKLGVNINMCPLSFEKNELKQNPQYHCACGSFLTNYDIGNSNYAEIRMFKPIPIGYIKVIIEDGRIKQVYPVIV